VVDVILFVGKILLLGLLYLFLFALVKTGIGAVGTGRPAEGRWRLLLKVIAGPKELRGVELDLADPILIGRTPKAGLVIADGFVSMRHAHIEPAERGPIITDLGSTNGTIVNDVRIEHPTRLNQGDVITLGDIRLEVRRP